MRKAALYIFSFGFFLVYVLSLNRSFMEWWADFRTYELGAAHARARYGDLYSNCFLPGYIDTAYIPLEEFPATSDATDLYILHDSYLEGKVKKENFKEIGKLVMADYRAEPVTVKPNPTRKNVLVIECSERTALWRLTDTSTAFLKMNADNRKEEPAFTDEETPAMAYLFNPNINQNLEFSLYDYEYFRPLKHLKAQLNFSLFNRLPKDVSVSTDKKYLLLSETVDPGSGTSSFIPLDQRYISYVVFCINYIADHFKKHGFDEVYFTIIPNPVSIVDQYRLPYNHKIELLESHHELDTPPISTYHLFRQTNERIYRRDDSHWNGKGLQMWVNEINRRLAP